MTQSFTLASGQVLSYEDSGNLNGRLPVLFFHGTPGSRLQLKLLPAALRDGLHWITFDRPGYGESGRQPGLTMTEVAAMGEVLVNRLGFDAFQVLGFSGGGPYALACAYAMPERVRGVHLAGSPGPTDLPEIWSALHHQDHALFTLVHRAPWLLRALLRLRMGGVRQKPEHFVAQLAAKMNAGDQSLLAAPDVLAKLCDDLREAMRQGTAGMADDFAVLNRPWPFRLEDVRVPVHIWQGAQDQLTSPQVGLAMAAHLPTAELHLLETGSHTLLLTHAAEVRTAIEDVSMFKSGY
ncbi:alpha/beta hydrolase [Acidithiobacillus sp.]|jgi:pimeloyl-ACP methyl ester carboxylesterase|uniref:alpha/beta fold hydrolase n=1 Tax=Acidithiobacillus sp. TaxID=1872118 RepID=UPI0025BB0422|nr:alpha/beta hydrolase [Acidithiobacillus sp.]MCK9187696.1 alpha/beta hydrolase [Acidithiobacillus sp.]MCK9358586.1 alpha/beta hydrolase [Acidithiobacillus sp.]